MRIATAIMLICTGVAGGQSFVNWESPHVNPITMTPDGAHVLVVNTADNRLEVFDAANGTVSWSGSIAVGLDPVSVRARDNDEIWVANHVSDTISVVRLSQMNVVATIPVGDEPTDVVFAGTPERAFVSVSQLNEVRVIDPDDVGGAQIVVPIEGEDPRALATNGNDVYVAIFEAGNGTTILDEFVVSSNINPYLGSPNPPPNAGLSFDPPIAGDLDDPPGVSQIVKRQGNGSYFDDNGGDWSAAVTWDLHGHDIGIIDANTLSVSYASGFMNANMNLAVGPTGDVAVIGTQATNEVRFEPNVNGTFVRVQGAVMSPGGGAPSVLGDLNPHLDYSVATVAQPMRDQSLGDPRGVAWNDDGSRIFVAGMGSNTVASFDAALNRVAMAEVGEGPTGVVHDGPRDLVYALNKFEGSVSVIDPNAMVEVDRVAYYDPTPAVIRTGRPHLYDTHATSGLGQASCGSCHIDGRMDQLAWDLGDPQGDMKPFNQVCNFGFGGCEDWHPMKGPMATQTLVGIIETGPLHWRADREDLAAFNGAFESLLGDDTQLTAQQMQEFTDFVETLKYPPNPFRNLDNSLRSSPLANGGTPSVGEILFNTAGLDGVECVTCHAMPTGTNGQLTSANLLQESQSMKIPQLRNMHEKTGFDQTSQSNNRGFGFVHDGNVPTLFEFLQFPGFQFAGGATGDQQRRDVESFMFSFSTDTHAGVGVQATMGGPLDQSALRDEMIGIAGSGQVGMVVKGVFDGEVRGFHRLGDGMFQSDRGDQVVSIKTLDAGVGAGAELTYTLVPAGSEVRIGVDRDEDGFFDRDELDQCTDPADPTHFPGSGDPPIPNCGDVCTGDVDGDGLVSTTDLLTLLADWGPCGECASDLDADGDVDTSDLLALLASWGPCESG